MMRLKIWRRGAPQKIQSDIMQPPFPGDIRRAIVLLEERAVDDHGSEYRAQENGCFDGDTAPIIASGLGSRGTLAAILISFTLFLSLFTF